MKFAMPSSKKKARNEWTKLGKHWTQPRVEFQFYMEEVQTVKKATFIEKDSEWRFPQSCTAA